MITSKASNFASGRCALVSIMLVVGLLAGCRCPAAPGLCPPDTVATEVDGKILCVVPADRLDAGDTAYVDAGADADAE
jgi:hypothetical protein